MELILKYFPNLTLLQVKQFEQLQELYTFWNEQINVISRKDTENFYKYFPRMSNSRFTASPTDNFERFVCSQV